MEVSVQGWELGVIHLESQEAARWGCHQFLYPGEVAVSNSFKITLSDSQHLTSCGTNISSRLLFSLNSFKSMLIFKDKYNLVDQVSQVPNAKLSNTHWRYVDPVDKFQPLTSNILGH